MNSKKTAFQEQGWSTNGLTSILVGSSRNQCKVERHIEARKLQNPPPAPVNGKKVLNMGKADINVMTEHHQASLDFVSSVHEQLELEELLRVAETQLCKHLDAKRGFVYLPWLKSLQSSDILPIRNRDIFLENIMRSGIPCNITDCSKHPYFQDYSEKYGLKSILVVPVLDAKMDQIGAIVVLNKISKQGFSEQDIVLGKLLSKHLGIALKNARSFHETKNELATSNAVLKVMSRLKPRNKLDDIIEPIHNLIQEISDAKNVSVFLLDEVSRYLHCSVNNFTMPTDRGIAGESFDSGQIIHVSCAKSHAAYEDKYHDACNIDPSRPVLCVPLKHGSDSLGVIQLLNPRSSKTKFSPFQVECVSRISEELAEFIHYKLSIRRSSKRASSVYQSKESMDKIISKIHHDAVSSQKAYEQFFTYSFDVWAFTADELVELTMGVFSWFDFMDAFRISPVTLNKFLVAVRDQYGKLPYHNYSHAMTTLQTSFMLLNSTGKPTEHLDRYDMFATCVAAYCHDMNHNGRTNDFHVRIQSKEAITYNDLSVLENIHAATCFATMKRGDHNILANIDDTERVRSTIVKAILATDMQKHGQMLEDLERLCEDCRSKNTIVIPDKILLVNAIVHSADISNPTFQWRFSQRWSTVLLDEFNSQYEEEIELGLTPTVFMNARPGTPEQAKLNISFIDACVLPLWDKINFLLKNCDSSVENIHSNRQKWADLL